MRKSFLGFTLIELMIVIAIIAFLSMISIPSFLKFLAKAKRSEAYLNLSCICTAQKSYWAENGKYTSNLSGKDGAGWKPSGSHYYTYGFANGSPGQSHFVGSLGATGADLKNSRVSDNEFVAVAVGDIDGDGVLDIIGIDQNNKITIIQDDLAD